MARRAATYVHTWQRSCCPRKTPSDVEKWTPFFEIAFQARFGPKKAFCLKMGIM
jgi:hypothetical protein